MDQGWAALLGAAVGGLGTFGATWFLDTRREERQAKNVAVAAASEIDSLLKLHESTSWTPVVEAAIESCRKGDLWVPEFHFLRDDLAPFARAAVGHSAVIDRRLAIGLARFVTLSDALVVNLRTMPLSLEAAKKAEGGPSPVALERALTNTLHLTRAWREVGIQVITMVDRLYPESPA